MQKEFPCMNNRIDFYFDIISPYSYIAYKKIEKIKSIEFNYMPILLGGLHNLAEIKAPAFNTYKLKNMMRDCELITKKNNINFNWNSKFPINSLYLMRGYLLIKENQKDKYLKTFFDAYWKDDIDLSDEKNIIKLLKNLNINNEKFFHGINNQLIKDNLKNLTNDAFKKEVFGAPTFIVNNKIFWGQDRLEYAVDELKNN
ncbi:2-hydroxychromene-2-carboxylate isomerase [Candidatus Pelagibacter sp.]|nr:2-hydroxychromene-2-carboxylate isomerase [Candidatus Pelagibacter sp.]